MYTRHFISMPLRPSKAFRSEWLAVASRDRQCNGRGAALYSGLSFHLIKTYSTFRPSFPDHGRLA